MGLDFDDGIREEGPQMVIVYDETGQPVTSFELGCDLGSLAAGNLVIATDFGCVVDLDAETSTEWEGDPVAAFGPFSDPASATDPILALGVQLGTPPQAVDPVSGVGTEIDLAAVIPGPPADQETVVDVSRDRSVYVTRGIRGDYQSDSVWRGAAELVAFAGVPAELSADNTRLIAQFSPDPAAGGPMSWGLFEVPS